MYSGANLKFLIYPIYIGICDLCKKSVHHLRKYSMVSFNESMNFAIFDFVIKCSSNNCVTEHFDVKSFLFYCEIYIVGSRMAKYFVHNVFQACVCYANVRVCYDMVGNDFHTFKF